MPNASFKDLQFRLDNAAGALTALTAYINQASLQRAVNMMEDSAMSDTNRSFLAGLAGTTLSLNGFVNSTVDGILGPLVSTNTSITKTFELRPYASRFYNGEAWVNNVQYSGRVDDMQTFSADLTIDGAVNRTSVALA